MGKKKEWNIFQWALDKEKVLAEESELKAFCLDVAAFPFFTL